MHALEHPGGHYTIHDAGGALRFTMRREDGIAPNGDGFADLWVLRDAAGAWVDHDAWRHDLFSHLRVASVRLAGVAGAAP